MQPEKRGSYLNEDLLKEIRGRSEYGARPLEGLLDRHQPPELRPYKDPPHKLDALGQAIGVGGFELNQLQMAAVELMEKDPHIHGALLMAYKRYIIMAKTICHDAIERVQQEEQKRHKEKAARDVTYKSKLVEWQMRTKKITDSWTEIRGTVKTRWRRLMRSLEKLISDDPSIHTMHHDDVTLLRMIEDRGRAKIVDGNVVDINWTYLQEDIDVETIDEMIRELERRIAEDGTWKKTQVRTLAELTS